MGNHKVYFTPSNQLMVDETGLGKTVFHRTSQNTPMSWYVLQEYAVHGPSCLICTFLASGSALPEL